MEEEDECGTGRSLCTLGRHAVAETVISKRR